ncbi:MAG: cytochrome c3 family protein [Planctomycetota bacterium]|jgi:hypothetical protein
MINTKYIVAGSLVLVPVVAGVALGAWLREPDTLPPQPIAFNHKLHLERAQGISCEDCHQFVTSQTYAGIPSKFICFDCHDIDAYESDTDAEAGKPELDALMGFADAEGDIPWHRVTTNRDDVFFSHRMHVTVAALDCRECHPKMPDRSSPPTRGPVLIEMDTCIGCHEESDASVDCISCHR